MPFGNNSLYFNGLKVYGWALINAFSGRRKAAAESGVTERPFVADTVEKPCIARSIVLFGIFVLTCAYPILLLLHSKTQRQLRSAPRGGGITNMERGLLTAVICQRS